jgi:nitrite reductase/ring-hydroxylating ferredoxin subunit
VSEAEPEPDLLAEVDRLIGELDAHPDKTVGERVRALVQGIDVVHRTGLGKLMAAIQGMAGDAFVNRLTADPGIRLLLMSYDLVAVDRRLLAEEAVDAVRGHLHSHGIDVEVTEVVGGVVYAKLHGVAEGHPAFPAAVRDLEAALKEGLLGFQELVPRDRDAVPRTGLVTLGALRGARKPVYRRALAADELSPGAMKAVEIEGVPLLAANIAGEIHVVQDRCGDTPLPLHFSALEGSELRCSFHGCRYDLRSGKRLDGEGERLHVFPARVENGEIQVALGVEAATP